MRLLLSLIHLLEGTLEDFGEIGATRILARLHGFVLGDRSRAPQFGEHYIKTSRINSHEPTPLVQRDAI
jgi:hypothetical protein